ncbi:MAG: 2Fe-2S iron-sulfur cluster-binding protein [Candidatus Calescibacterium sp.]|nr:2Fe-2S iron-sulfur cluster-binding protein [Candidatus Calescibacterium sp.]MCX7972021.1 2Fe-2S iron-sulfur cluster-binding protein [bacterium]MDW8194695.1 2Fe-2S iron-sulfur cluster-binding protein [Candidatus Calescibacterium sp.]
MRIFVDEEELVLDDQKANQTIYSILTELGKYIPVGCHLDGLTPIGACRMCIVEVQGFKKPVSSCITKPFDGMKIYTNTEKLKIYRKYLTEFLFGERPHPCHVCLADGSCELQTWKFKIFEIKSRMIDYSEEDHKVDQTHKLYVLDHNRCILCFRCVRICHEYAGPHTLDVKGMGSNARIVIDLDDKWAESKSCISCGKCVMVCPTGALYMKNKEISKTRRFDIPKFLESKGKRIKVFESMINYI